MRSQPLVKDRPVVPAGNLKDKRFVGAVRSEVRIDALSQLRCIHPDNIVLASVVVRWSPKNPLANLLLVDFRAPIFERLSPDVKQEITKAN